MALDFFSLPVLFLAMELLSAFDFFSAPVLCFAICGADGDERVEGW